MDKKNKSYSKTNIHKSSTPKNHLSTNLLKAEFTGKENKSKLIFFIGLFAVAPVILLVGLLIDYLVYYPNLDDNPDKYLVSGDNIGPFVITICLIAVMIAFAIFIAIALRKRVIFDDRKKVWTLVGIGIGASFLDTIGVGSYAVTMGLMKATKTNDDDSKFSGTMTVGYCVPQLIEGTIFTAVVQFEWQTLLVLTACAIIGGLIGSWLSKHINSQVFRFVISILMFIVGIVMVLSHPNVGVIGLSGTKNGFIVGADKSVGLIIGSAFIFIVLGALSSLGLGIYAPALAILSLMGMSTTAIFPIMSVAAAAMMPPAAIKFIKDKNYLLPHTAIFNIVGGLGCVVSFLVFFVGLEEGANMDKDTFNAVLKWIATAVVFYCSGLMIYSFAKDYKKSGWKQPKYDPDIL